MTLFRNTEVNSKDHWFLRMLTSYPLKKKKSRNQKIRKTGFFAAGTFIFFNVLDFRAWSISKFLWNILWLILALKKGTSFFLLTAQYTALLKCPKPTLKLSAWLKEHIIASLNN